MPVHRPGLVHCAVQVLEVIEPSGCIGQGDDVCQKRAALRLEVAGVDILQETPDGGLIAGVVRIIDRVAAQAVNLAETALDVIQENAVPAKLFLALLGAAQPELAPFLVAGIHQEVLAIHFDAAAVGVQQEPIRVILADGAEIPDLVSHVVAVGLSAARPRIHDRFDTDVLQDRSLNAIGDQLIAEGFICSGQDECAEVVSQCGRITVFGRFVEVSQIDDLARAQDWRGGSLRSGMAAHYRQEDGCDCSEAEKCL